MKIDVVRAWKDPEYRKTLTKEELNSLPANPASTGELTEEELLGVSGGMPIPVSGQDSFCTCPKCK